MMRTLLFAIFLLPAAAAFVTMVGPHHHPTVSTALRVERRDVMIWAAGLASILAAAPPQLVQAKGSTFFFDDEKVREPSQMPTSGKFDLNAAFVGDYKILPGFFPHAAGKIASNGPYEKVSDIYQIKGLTPNDRALFKKYEQTFTVNPPGRGFAERINQRFST